MASDQDLKGAADSRKGRASDPRKADAAYKPFPPFGDWAETVLDETRWDRYTAGLRELKAASPESLKRSLEIVKRASAFDTGAIEGLYETDRGLTFTVATESAMWEAALDKRSEKARPLFEAQLKAYDAVLDLATQAVPIAEAWIRELHRQICNAQDTYRAWTELGWQELRLPRGEYKSLPNHVLLADGSVHSYAPVDMTPTEMHRLCQEVNSDEFKSAHPALQASFAHYAVTVIHPFADGNGRVARALASVFTYRCCSVPVMVLSESRGEYLATLRKADAGNFRAFVSFVIERTLDAIQLAQVSIQAAEAPSVEEGVQYIKRLYITKGGYTQEQIDSAALTLSELIRAETARRIAAIAGSDTVYGFVNAIQQSYRTLRPDYRLPTGSKLIQVNLSLRQPAAGTIVSNFGVDVPKDCGKEDDIIIHELESGKFFEVRVTELLPSPTTALQMRLSVWIEGLLRDALVKLSEMARNSLKQL